MLIYLFNLNLTGLMMDCEGIGTGNNQLCFNILSHGQNYFRRCQLGKSSDYVSHYSCQWKKFVVTFS